MKKILVMAITIATMLTSCGTPKKTASTDYQYLQWLAQQQQQQAQPQQAQQQLAQQRPGRTQRTLEPCIELAQADAENLRAYGTATSYVEKVALNEAERDARNRLAAMLKTAVEGAAQDYERNANKNLKNTAGNLGESIMTQFVAGEISNTKIIKTTIYDLADGSIQVYVCLEMKTNKDDFDNNLKNTLDRDGLIELQYDRDRFIEHMKKGLEDYKQQNMK